MYCKLLTLNCLIYPERVSLCVLDAFDYIKIIKREVLICYTNVSNYDVVVDWKHWSEVQIKLIIAKHDYYTVILPLVGTGVVSMTAQCKPYSCSLYSMTFKGVKSVLGQSTVAWHISR